MKYTDFYTIKKIVFATTYLLIINSCSSNNEKDSKIKAIEINNEISVQERISLLEDSLRKFPQDIDILNEISYGYASMNDRRSLSTSDKMISLKNVEGAAALGHFNKGIFYSNVNESDSAIIEFSAAIDEDYRMTDAYIEKAILLFDQKKYNLSFLLLEKATLVNKYLPSLYFWMAKNKLELGNKEEALFYFKQCLELKPSQDEATEANEMIKRLEK